VFAGTDYSEILFLPRLVPLLRREAPGIDLVTLFLGDDVERAIQAREVDLAIVTQLRGLSGILQRKVRHEEMRVLMRKGHAALKQPLTPESYAALDHVLVSPRSLPGSAVDSALELLGLTRRVVVRTQHFAVAAHLVEKTDLVVTLPGVFADRMAQSLQLVAVPVPVQLRGFTFSIGYNASFENDPAHRWFRERVVEIGCGEVAA
jgi:DNA-binding transcriptional LysR family regulator